MPDRTHGGVVRRIYGNLGRLLSGKAAAGLLSLAYMAIAARTLGPAEYGVLILVHTYAMTVGGVIEFPGWHAVVRYGSQALAIGDHGRLTRLLAVVALIEIAGGVAAIIVAAVAAPIIGPKLGWSATAIAFAPAYSFAVLASIRATPAGYLQLAGRFDLIGWHSLVAPLVRLGGAVVATATHAGLGGFLIAWLAAALAEWSAMWIIGVLVARRRLLFGALRTGIGQAWRENPGIWRFMLAANVDVTGAELAGRLAPLAVGWVIGPAGAGLYAVAQRATTVLAQPGQILGQAAYAELAQLAAQGDGGPRIRAAVARTILIAAFAAAPVCVIVALFGRNVAAVVAGKAFAAAGPIMLWLMLARAVLLAGPPISAALTALGRPALSAVANLGSGLGLLIVLPPAMTWFGLAGAGAHALGQALVAVSLLAAFAWQATAQTASASVVVRA